MKHIKKYDYMDSLNRYEELSEYLQEIFDKYHISYAFISGDDGLSIYSPSFKTNPIWAIIPHLSFWCISIFANEYIIKDIFIDLEKNKSNIEDRIGNQIWLEKRVLLSSSILPTCIRIMIITDKYIFL